jgi:hypothetical protein
MARNEMARRTTALIVIGTSVIALGGLYVTFERTWPHAAAATALVTPGAGAASSPVVAAPTRAPLISEPRVAATLVQPSSSGPFHIAITKEKPGVETRPLLAVQGDSVTIVLTTDQAGTVEVHGYGMSVAVKPESESTLAFRAERTGRFPIHLHVKDGRHLDVTALEVRPQ